MTSTTVFYSWQSDLPFADNRALIQDSLESCVESLRGDRSLNVEPVIERDTAGVPGSPDIASTIFQKIDASCAFICDVSIIGQTTGGRPTPNPNVMLELGYAAKTLGWGRILLIMNEAYGSLRDLPFDLRGKRVIRYTTAGLERSAAKDLLVGELLPLIRLLFVGAPPSQLPQAIPSGGDRSWAESEATKAFLAFPRDVGISIQVFAAVYPKPSAFDHSTLLRAAERSQVQTFGWPIGVVNEFYRPRPTKDGIVSKIVRDVGYDYWALQSSGNFYALMVPEETRRGENRAVFFDWRVFRATEVCMYLGNLYSALEVPESSQVFIEMRYAGLAGTLLKASPRHVMFGERGPAVESAVNPCVTTTLSELRSDIQSAAVALTSELFLMFDFFKLREEDYKWLVDNYVAGNRHVLG